MKRLVPFLALLATVIATPNLGSIAHLGKTIPVHIPTQTLTVNETFEVPYWLGAYYATVEVTSNWTLPLTIGSGGQTYPGQFLFIRNYGPESITLYPQSPETIEGAVLFTILPGTIIEILSGYPNWVVVTPNLNQSITVNDLNIEGDVYYHSDGPLDLGNLQWVHMFNGVDDSGSTINPLPFTIQIGNDTLNPPPNSVCNSSEPGSCAGWDAVSIGHSAGSNNIGINVNNLGPFSGQSNTGINVNNLGPFSGQSNTGVHVNNLGPSAGQRNTGNYISNLGPLSGQNNTGNFVNNLGPSAGQVNTGTNVNNLGSSAGQNNVGSYVNNLGPSAGQNNTGNFVNNLGPSAGRNNIGSDCSFIGNAAGQSNTFNRCYAFGPSATCTATNQFVLGTSTVPLQLRLPSDTGSFCMGAAYDTCLNRGRAGAFTLGTDQDLYSTGYVCAGPGCTSSAPVATSTGLYDSNVRVVRSCVSGTGITCSVTDGVLTVSANSNLQDIANAQQKRIELLEARMEKMQQLIDSLAK